jgi:hypothetical protein
MPVLNIIIAVCAIAVTGSVGFKIVRDRTAATTMVDQLCERLEELPADKLKSEIEEEKEAISEIKDICEDRAPLKD